MSESLEREVASARAEATASRERCRSAIVLAGELADEAQRAVALVSEWEEQFSRDAADAVVREVQAAAATELAREVLAELRAPGAIAERGVPGVEPERQPMWWVGKLEGALAAMLRALEGR